MADKKQKICIITIKAFNLYQFEEGHKSFVYRVSVTSSSATTTTRYVCFETIPSV